MPLRILHIDDNPDDRTLAARALAGEFPDAVIRWAADADAFAAALEDDRLDLVITDYQLRWSTGIDVLRRVKARHPYLPVVMFTGTGSEEIAAEGLRLGLDDYVTKSPSHYVRLAVAVRGALERSRFEAGRQRVLEELKRAKDAAEAARAEAENASRLKDEFLATVSHELRTPLNAILGWASLLRTRKLPAEDVAAPLETIERNARTQTRLVEDLLDVSRIVSGRLRLDVEAVELIPVIEAAVDTVRGAAEARNVTISKVLDTSLGPVSGDPNRLQQVVWNLLSNAVKFTPSGGRITVRLERVDSKAEVSVADNGAGIEAAFLPHIFERFRQADASSTRATSGLGIGLSIVKHLVELHGGTVTAKSPGPGKGATFVVTIPLAPVQLIGSRPAVPLEAGGASEGDAPAASLLGVSVLVVDDEADARELIEAILRGAGAAVASAASAEQAVALLPAVRPHVMVSDIGMPGEDGYTLLRRVRELEARPGHALSGRRLPAIALTAFARAEDRRRALLRGYQVHLPKPVDPAELLAAVANVAQVPPGGAR